MSLKEAIKDVKERMVEEGRPIYISGKNAEGLYQFLKRQYFEKVSELPDDAKDINEHTHNLDEKTVAVLRTDDYEKADSLYKKHPKTVIIDPENSMKLPDFEVFYGLSSPFYVDGERKRDVDNSIADATAGLYLNVFDAFIDYGEGEDAPYFRTSELIDYDRSKAILTGLLQSAMMKFPVKSHLGKKGVLASREVTGTEGKDDVKMYELAIMLSDKVGLEPVKIEKRCEDDDSWLGDYVIRKDLEERNVLLLDDVIWTGKTIKSLESAVEKAHGNLVQTIVLMNRSGENIPKVYELTTMKNFMELKKRKEEKELEKMHESASKKDNFQASSIVER